LAGHLSLDPDSIAHPATKCNEKLRRTATVAA